MVGLIQIKGVSKSFYVVHPFLVQLVLVAKASLFAHYCTPALSLFVLHLLRVFVLDSHVLLPGM